MYDEVFYPNECYAFCVNIANKNFEKIIFDCFVILFIRKQSLLYLYNCLSALQISQIQNIHNDILLYYPVIITNALKHNRIIFLPAQLYIRPT